VAVRETERRRDGETERALERIGRLGGVPKGFGVQFKGVSRADGGL